MKNLFLGATIVCAPCFANNLPPKEVVQSCLMTESVNNTNYTDISPTEFTTDDATDNMSTATTVAYRGHIVGISESTKNKDFSLIYDSLKIPKKKIVKLGLEPPSAFTPFTAQWGESQFKKIDYMCITFNLPGIGQSGSLQNIRGLYIFDMNKPQKIYYTEGDIRKFNK